MPQHLRKVAATTQRRSVTPQETIPRDHNCQRLRIDPGEQTNRDSRRRRKIARLKQIRGSLEELIHLADAHGTVPRTPNGHQPAKGAIDAHARQLLTQLTRLLEPAARNAAKQKESANEPRQASGRLKQLTPPITSGGSRLRKLDTVRVQMRLSKALTAILAAFRRSGQDPGDIAERCLWQNPAIRDAAAILGVQMCGHDSDASQS